MSAHLTILRAGPGLTVQDLGRPGYLDMGLSRGGAVDRLALAEGAALLGQADSLAAVEMAGMGGEFQADQDLRIALTGARMRAQIDGATREPGLLRSGVGAVEGAWLRDGQDAADPLELGVVDAVADRHSDLVPGFTRHAEVRR